LHAFTYSQRPDIAIEIDGPNGYRDAILFDPKYKLDGSIEQDSDRQRPVKPDIDKMHAYRDAIRDSHGKPVVSFAAVMYPGRTIRFGDGIAALGASPSLRNQLHEELKVILARALWRAQSSAAPSS
jgi:predicted component of viral defense system (DUF524 family)